MDKINKPEAEWRQQLSEEEYRICREKGTEPAFSGAFWQVGGQEGTYLCRCCGEALFDSQEKFDSGSGWPSFTAPKESSAIEEHPDESFGMRRTEVTCARCDAHLGHVFPDGPGPTGLRYCVNSASLAFAETAEEDSSD